MKNWYGKRHTIKGHSQTRLVPAYIACKTALNWVVKVKAEIVFKYLAEIRETMMIKRKYLCAASVRGQGKSNKPQKLSVIIDCRWNYCL